VIGIGKFAEDRARAALEKTGIGVGGMLHPSPASPAANRGWQAQAEKQLSGLGVLDALKSA
jgi:single-strand selective monofunctional uracil DNA glycosylase